MATVYHHGATTSSGHYTSKICYADVAYICDDHKVSVTDIIHKEKSKSCYIIFYSKNWQEPHIGMRIGVSYLETPMAPAQAYMGRCKVPKPCLCYILMTSLLALSLFYLLYFFKIYFVIFLLNINLAGTGIWMTIGLLFCMIGIAPGFSSWTCLWYLTLGTLLLFLTFLCCVPSVFSLKLRLVDLGVFGAPVDHLPFGSWYLQWTCRI